MFKKILIAFFLTIVLIFAVGYIYVNARLDDEIPHVETVDVHIPKGTSISGAIDILSLKGILRPNWMFKLAARYYASTEDKGIFAGYYSFEPGTTNIEVLKALFSGRMLNIFRVTFPEGISVERFADILEKQGGIDKDEFMRAAKSAAIIKEYNIPAKSLEGYLMPDTYEFFRKEKPERILRALLDAQAAFWEERISERAEAMGMTRHEALTLASIIEAESPNVNERPRVSGVYHNRLNRNWLLQADPTVQYAIGEKRRLLRRDLDHHSPYNTYKHPGLPPGPINNPGRSAIDAALNPEAHDYMYFVAVGDGSGRHNFSKTLAQHNIYKSQFKRNVRRGR